MSNYIKKLPERSEKINIIKNKYEDRNLKILGSFDNIGNLMRGKIETKCTICGHEWFSNPDHVLNGGRGCPMCGRKKVGQHNKILLLKKSLENYNRYGDLEEYRKFVRTYTYQTIKLLGLFKNIKLGHSKKSKHIDHIRSVYDCLRDRIPPEIVGSEVNIQLLTWKENLSKYKNSWQSKSDLMRKYKQWIKNNPKYQEIVSVLPKFKF